MKPAPFEYQAPASLDAALDLLAHHAGDIGEAKVLAGGQSLIPVMNFRLAEPALLVDINKLTELDFIHRGEDGGLRIGGLTRQRRLERDPLVAEVAPLLHETMPFIAHPQIRNRGTLGGSLAHADPAAELPAIAVALRARLRLRKAGGERWVDAADFFRGLFTTLLEPDEMLVEVAIPPLPPRTGWAFLEIARRHGDYAQVGLAALVTLDDAGRCREARLVYLSAGDRPVEAREAARLLAGQEISPQAITAAADKASRDEMEPFGDIHATAEFKRHLARVLTGRALRQAAERAERTKGRAA
ncbi:MAG TPA: xanthine dehydrogenase family protein subunit M [Thermoanaerobaculia bacterium]|jgi:carbon-monoxide dehydrogenase medium subunit|nr:xanthine dehydrogenase family protein subunit M [Thermoanaerobaculia bacterium]